jgi:ADP-dependent NAD(P)H-hydrate dehydratase / NAD(P)H-hydrate epimerase
MKILPVAKIREADAYTIENEPIASDELMERAATACYQWLKKRVDNKRRVLVFCGMGNNGGDGLVIARLMGQHNHNIEVFVIRHSERFSLDFNLNFNRLQEVSSITVRDIYENSSLPAIGPDDVVIDAIFGSGLTKPATGLAASVIRHISSSQALVVAIDFPSGLMSDAHTDEKSGPAVKADFTLTFQMPKLSFMFAENDAFIGEWKVIDIGLDQDFIGSLQVKDHLILKEDVGPLLHSRTKFSHKGTYGHALLIAGSYGKIGAAVLASRACLRSGVGLLHTHTPGAGAPILQTAVPEAMLSIDPDEHCFSQVPDLAMFTAIGTGPGIGFDDKTKRALKLLIQNTKLPLLFDADAITILGENRTWIPFVPKNSVFTPHPKEFERLVGPARNDFHRNQLQREFCIKYGVFVVLKGAHTCTCTPDGTCYFNSTGNPGMATGGSGDVLTGLILGLLAQHYSPKDACLLGVFLHGLAGDLAARKHGMEALIAGDIVDFIGKAYKKL